MRPKEISIKRILKTIIPPISAFFVLPLAILWELFRWKITPITPAEREHYVEQEDLFGR